MWALIRRTHMPCEWRGDMVLPSQHEWHNLLKFRSMSKKFGKQSYFVQNNKMTPKIGDQLLWLCFCALQNCTNQLEIAKIEHRICAQHPMRTETRQRSQILDIDTAKVRLKEVQLAAHFSQTSYKKHQLIYKCKIFSSNGSLLCMLIASRISKLSSLSKHIDFWYAKVVPKK